jgi:hypothetical protein
MRGNDAGGNGEEVSWMAGLPGMPDAFHFKCLFLKS